MNIQHIGRAKECAKLSPGECEQDKQPCLNSTCSVSLWAGMGLPVGVDENLEFEVNIAAFLTVITKQMYCSKGK